MILLEFQLYFTLEKKIFPNENKYGYDWLQVSAESEFLVIKFQIKRE